MLDQARPTTPTLAGDMHGTPPRADPGAEVHVAIPLEDVALTRAEPVLAAIPAEMVVAYGVGPTVLWSAPGGGTAGIA